MNLDYRNYSNRKTLPTIVEDSRDIKKQKISSISSEILSQSDKELFSQANAYADKVIKKYSGFSKEEINYWASNPLTSKEIDEEFFKSLPPVPDDDIDFGCTEPLDSDSEEERAQETDHSSPPSSVLESSSPPSLQLEAGDDVGILYYDKEELFSEINKISKGKSFSTRFDAFSKLFTSVESRKELWVTMHSHKDENKAIHFKVCLFPCAYFSEAFDKSCFPASKQFYELRVYDYLGQDDEILEKAEPLLRMRISKNETELVWLGKGEKAAKGEKAISGTEVGLFAMEIQKMLGTPLYLYDDAKIHMEGKKTLHSPRVGKKDDGAIWLKAFAIVDGKTWYERTLGVRPAKIKDWLMIKKKDIPMEAWHMDEEIDPNAKQEFLNQDPEKYDGALKELQVLKLSDIDSFYKKYRSLSIRSIANRAFNTKKANLSKITLQELGSRVVDLAKKSKGKENSGVDTQKLQKNYHDAFFKPYEYDESVPEAEKDFCQKVHTLVNTRVFVWEPQKG